MSILLGQINYELKDPQIMIIKSVDIAFNHLQRQLIADQSIQTTWSNLKETDYEKLGGAHFLMHKIWAFKVNEAGQRTDLVLADKVIDESDSLSQSVTGLVLTEWKIVDENRSQDSQIEQAKKQCEKYSNGSLAAVELLNYRYLVLVSKNYLKNLKPEIIDNANGITYKIINIAYAPKTPSKL
jgi:hypothetical protein